MLKEGEYALCIMNAEAEGFSTLSICWRFFFFISSRLSGETKLVSVINIFENKTFLCFLMSDGNDSDKLLLSRIIQHISRWFTWDEQEHSYQYPPFFQWSSNMAWGSPNTCSLFSMNMTMKSVQLCVKVIITLLEHESRDTWFILHLPRVWMVPQK